MAQRSSRGQGRPSQGRPGKGAPQGRGKGAPQGRNARQGDAPRRNTVRKGPGTSRRTDRPEAASHRPRVAGDYIEGRRAVAEALAAGVPLKGLMVADRLAAEERGIEDILTAARDAQVPARTVSRDLLDRLSAHGAHQGVIAEARPFSYVSLEEVIEAARGKENALIVVCDHVTDPGNLGAIARSAEIVGASGLLIPNRRAAQVTATAYKASAGALAYLPVALEANLANCLTRLQEEGFWVAGASEHAETDVWHAPLTGRIALVLGSEGDGISPLVQSRCDFLVRLPQVGRIESLNVAQSATALMYEWLRRTIDAEAPALEAGE